MERPDQNENSGELELESSRAQLQQGLQTLWSKPVDYAFAKAKLESSFDLKSDEGVFFFAVCCIKTEDKININQSIEYFSKKGSCLENYCLYLQSKFDNNPALNQRDLAASKGHLNSRYYKLFDEYKKSNIIRKILIYFNLIIIKLDIIKNSKSRADKYIHEFDLI